MNGHMPTFLLFYFSHKITSDKYICMYMYRMTTPLFDHYIQV